MRLSPLTLVVLAVACLLLAGALPAQAQEDDEVPEDVREELDAQGLTEAEARARARQLGIDLSDPEQAARRARELGIPEARIQALLRAVERSESGSQASRDAPDPFVPAAEAGVAPVSADTTTPPPDDTLRAEEGAAGEAPREELPYFGYGLFDDIPDAFRPDPVGPVSGAYVVGPGDELRLLLWGATELQRDLTVDREGRIFVPGSGQLTVSGKTLDGLRREMRQWLSRTYAGLTTEPPSISMDLTVTRVRPIKVFVLGEVAQPGGYTLSSYATVFNALYSVGGPLRRGSLRDVRIIRGGRLAAEVDLYDYLLTGYEGREVNLQTNDRIFIPPRGKTVAVTGAVKRPAYYELKEGETFADALRYAGGLTPNAYVRRFQINRIVPFDERTDPSVARTVLDLDLQAARQDTAAVALADADRIKILTIREAGDRALVPRVNRAVVAGAVFQPGPYELGPNLRTVRDLIEQADGLTGDAYRLRAELIRIEPNLRTSVRALDLKGVMDDAPTANIVLRPGDSLRVASVGEIEADRLVRVTGQVREPGDYALRTNMTVADLLFKGGGLRDEVFLRDVFLDRADLYRVDPDGTERIIPFDLGAALAGSDFARRALRPGDTIRVYPVEVETQREVFVVVSGAVQSPGRYRLREGMTITDAVLQAGGFAENALRTQVEVTRQRRDKDGAGETRARRLDVPLARAADGTTGFGVDADATFRLRHRDRVYVRVDPAFVPQETVTVRGEVRFPGEYTLLRDNETLADVLGRAGGALPTGYLRGGRLFRSGQQVILEMDEAVRQRDPEDDVILRPGDQIVVPPQPNTVAVRGNVANEGLIKYKPGARVSYYLERAGGTLDRTQDILLTQASGATFRVDEGWFRVTPQVDDGASIRVTRKPPKEDSENEVDVQKTITTVTGLLTTALTLIVLSERAFN